MVDKVRRPAASCAIVSPCARPIGSSSLSHAQVILNAHAPSEPSSYVCHDFTISKHLIYNNVVYRLLSLLLHRR